jgi:hypothetical protein
MTTLDSLLDTQAIETPRPRRYVGAHRVPRQPIGSLAALAVGLVLMTAATVLGIGLKFSPDAVVAPRSVAPAPAPWVEPSHPAGTGESLRIRKEETR